MVFFSLKLVDRLGLVKRVHETRERMYMRVCVCDRESEELYKRRKGPVPRKGLRRVVRVAYFFAFQSNFVKRSWKRSWERKRLPLFKRKAFHLRSFRTLARHFKRRGDEMRENRSSSSSLRPSWHVCTTSVKTRRNVNGYHLSVSNNAFTDHRTTMARAKALFQDDIARWCEGIKLMILLVIYKYI